jgi:hypothetical protein
MEIKLTFSALPIVAVLLSLAAYYVPGFNKWFEALAAEKKQLFNIGVLFVVVLGAVGLSAAGFLNIYAGATWKEWLWFPLVDFVIGIMTNAGFYKGTNYLMGK